MKTITKLVLWFIITALNIFMIRKLPYNITVVILFLETTFYSFFYFIYVQSLLRFEWGFKR